MSLNLEQVAASCQRPVGATILEQAQYDLSEIARLAGLLAGARRSYPYREADCREIIRLCKGIATDLRGIGRVLDDYQRRETEGVAR